MKQGEVIGGILGVVFETALGSGAAKLGGAAKGLTTVDKVADVSPNVKKVFNTIDNIKKEGGGGKVNPLDPKQMQELNMTFSNSDGSKLDLRIESHKLPQRLGGDGVNPTRHMNATVTNSNGNTVKMKHINGGHKVLE